jgi:ubiquinone/menaquinone biosynthesis C-methylase UbiE
MGSADKLFTDGEAYERMMGRWSRVAGEPFLDWLNIPKGLRWLDVGCGNGAFTEEIIARCAAGAVMAIDPSEDQLAFARTRPGAKMAKFEVGDAQKLTFGDDTSTWPSWRSYLRFWSTPRRRSRKWRAWCALAVGLPLTCGIF